MAHDVQIAVDCARPHELADWWAEVLRWEVEPQDEAFIRRIVDQGHATEDQTVRHNGALVWKSATAIRSPDPGRPRILFQVVPEPKTVKNRLHLDVRVGTGLRGEQRLAALEAEAVRLVALGASRGTLLVADEENESCQVMHDVEGNEFCLD